MSMERPRTAIVRLAALLVVVVRLRASPQTLSMLFAVAASALFVLM